MPDSTLDTVVAILRQQFGNHTTDITRDTNIAEEFGADSLDAVEIMFELEDQFGIAIQDEEAEKCKTVGDVVGLVQAKRHVQETEPDGGISKGGELK